jgi:hypothetical protein
MASYFGHQLAPKFFSWINAQGGSSPPSALRVLVLCATPTCVRPSHLYGITRTSSSRSQKLPFDRTYPSSPSIPSTVRGGQFARIPSAPLRPPLTLRWPDSLSANFLRVFGP